MRSPSGWHYLRETNVESEEAASRLILKVPYQIAISAIASKRVGIYRYLQQKKKQRKKHALPDIREQVGCLDDLMSTKGLC